MAVLGGDATPPHLCAHIHVRIFAPPSMNRKNARLVRVRWGAAAKARHPVVSFLKWRPSFVTSMGLILLTPEECAPPESPIKESISRKRARAGAHEECGGEEFLAPSRASTPTPVARAGSPPPLSSASSSASDASRISVQSKGSAASNRSHGSSMCSIAPPKPSTGKRARAVVVGCGSRHY